MIQSDLNKGLHTFSDRQFDCVVLSQTLQAVVDVEGLMDDILRVGRIGIVSFPNLAFHKLVRMLAEGGRSPKTEGILHYEWYDTPNRRFFTLLDFEEFCHARGIRIHRQIALDTEAGVEVFENANRNADLAIFVISR